MRVALYARYSSDRQNERSIEDQFGVCRRHAAAHGWTVVAEFSDAAISGSAMANRPGLLTMLAAAAGDAFDLVLVEDEDRLARNLEHQAHVFNRLKHLGVAIATLASEKIGILEVGLKGVMAELYLVNLGQKTSRGMRANAEQGLATGSRLFGYRSEPGGAMAIVETEAEVVREIFTRYVAGETARDIAGDFNRRAVQAVRGLWNAGQINGSRKRANGVLYTELYVGVKVWNRMVVTKDTDTGRRLPRMKPPSEWRRTPAEHLRIVPQALWDAAQARKGAESAWRPEEISAGRRGLFSGLLKCGCCGASYTSYSRTRLVCSAHRGQGPSVCTNSRKAPRAAIEARVLEGLRTRMATPEASAAYVRAYHAARAELAATAGDRRRPIERRIAELNLIENRYCDDVEAGRSSEKGWQRAIASEQERHRLETELGDMAATAAAPPAIALHPRAPEAYARLVGQLQAHLAEAAHDTAARPLIDDVRGLVLRIDLHPDETAPDGFHIDLVGDLARLMDLPAEDGGYTAVAGGGIEPPTCGL